MDSSSTRDATPRRSTRLQEKHRDKTPEPSLSAYKPRGPRAMAKLNKGKLNQTVPAIVITSPEKTKEKKDPVQTPEVNIESQKKPTSDELKGEVTNDDQVEEVKGSTNCIGTEENNQANGNANNIDSNAYVATARSQTMSSEYYETYAQAVAHADEHTEVTLKGEELPLKKDSLNENQGDIKQSVASATPQQTQVEDILNVTPPQLMDESIISVPESIDNTTMPPKDATFSPEPNKSTKDSTFSPIIDKSIHDSRPHIDENEFNTTPIPRNIPHRTSTPLAQKVLKRDTPKAGAAAMSSLAKVFSPNVAGNVVEALSDTVGGQFKFVNPLERSILKSTRKRSLSVADSESFVQKRVMFISPKVMDIGEIDERMMQSFREEKENSILKTQLASGARRKRSLSASETPVPRKTPKKQIPDFKAIHEAQFKKMESILEHKERKAARAKRFVTPTKSLPVISQGREQPQAQSSQPVKVNAASKIPKASRKPLHVKPPTENAQVNRPLKRSMSAEATSQVKKPAFKPTLSRAMSQEVVKPKIAFPPIQAKSQPSKTEERREKNMSLYKTNATRTGNADFRKKNENLLKGVRLNRRFELMMKNRMASGTGDHADD